MADSLFMLWVLANSNVDFVLPHDRRGHEVAARAPGAELINGALGIAVELPDDLTGVGIDGIQPTVTAGKDHLALAVDLHVNRVGPLAVHEDQAAIDQVLHA